MTTNSLPDAIDELIRRSDAILGEMNRLIQAASQPPPLWPTKDQRGTRPDPTHIRPPQDRHGC
jgi:hypothetical protein